MIFNRFEVHHKRVLSTIYMNKEHNSWDPALNKALATLLKQAMQYIKMVGFVSTCFQQWPLTSIEVSIIYVIL